MSVRLRVQSLASPSGWRIWHCLSCSINSPSLGTSLCSRYSPKKKERKKKGKLFLLEIWKVTWKHFAGFRTALTTFWPSHASLGFLTQGLGSLLIQTALMFLLFGLHYFVHRFSYSSKCDAGCNCWQFMWCSLRSNSWGFSYKCLMIRLKRSYWIPRTRLVLGNINLILI